MTQKRAMLELHEAKEGEAKQRCLQGEGDRDASQAGERYIFNSTRDSFSLEGGIKDNSEGAVSSSKEEGSLLLMILQHFAFAGGRAEIRHDISLRNAYVYATAPFKALWQPGDPLSDFLPSSIC